MKQTDHIKTPDQETKQKSYPIKTKHCPSTDNTQIYWYIIFRGGYILKLIHIMAFQMLHTSDLSQAVDRTQNGKQSGRSWPSKPASITQSHFNHCTSKQPSCYRNIVWGNASHWPLIKSSHQSAALILSHGLGSVKQCLHQRPAKSSQCQPVRWGTDLLKHYAKQLSLIDVCWRLPDVAFSLPMSRRLHDIASLSPRPPFFSTTLLSNSTNSHVC